MPRLLIFSDDLALVESQAAAALPAECCGLLLGRSVNREMVRVDAVVPCANLAADRSHRFTISPQAFLDAYRRARRRGDQVVGTYHSHPRGAAVPSALDRESAWPGASYLILGLGEEEVRERRSWRFGEGEFVEERLEVLAGEEEGRGT
jgi:proteasome lid subunit RPN8/RPN11